MAHLFQVGAGSGGMPVLDMVARDSRVKRVTLVEPDVYKPHNVERHYFGPEAVGQLKANLAKDWLQARRPELRVEALVCDVTDAARQSEIEEAVASVDLGVCAVDNEPAKFHWDALMRTHAKPWTLGEVLSGGIGGFIHWFVPGGPCYGCVAGFLKREGTAPEAALKFFLVGTVSAAVLAYGMSFMYGVMGTTLLSAVPAAMAQAQLDTPRAVKTSMSVVALAGTKGAHVAWAHPA